MTNLASHKHGTTVPPRQSFSFREAALQRICKLRRDNQAYVWSMFTRCFRIWRPPILHGFPEGPFEVRRPALRAVGCYVVARRWSRPDGFVPPLEGGPGQLPDLGQSQAHRAQVAHHLDAPQSVLIEEAVIPWARPTV